MWFFFRIFGTDWLTVCTSQDVKKAENYAWKKFQILVIEEGSPKLEDGGVWGMEKGIFQKFLRPGMIREELNDTYSGRIWFI